MRILHISDNALPWITGGTEVFCHQLALAQQASGCRVILCCHKNDQRQEPIGWHEYHRASIHVLPPLPDYRDRLTLVKRRTCDPVGFAALLQEVQPEIVHFHAFSQKVGLTHLELAREAGSRTVATIHAPGFTCMQGSLLYHRQHLCDGQIRLQRCTECRLVNGRLPFPLAWAVSHYGWPLFNPDNRGKLNHVLTARQMTAFFQQSWRTLVENIDALHVLCKWSSQVLLRNGVPAGKVHLIRTGGPPPIPGPRREPMEDGVLRAVYWGRCAEVKGIHVIIDAIKRLPTDAPIEVTFYGPYWDDDYGRQMKKFIVRDSRFHLAHNIPHADLLQKLKYYDVALVPSIWLETGPLTVLEAFAAGLPVLGSCLGGIGELVQDGVNGELFETGKSQKLAAIIKRLIQEPDSVRKLQANVKLSRTMSDVAEDTINLYDKLQK